MRLKDNMRKFLLIIALLTVAIPAFAAVSEIETAIMNKDFEVSRDLSAKLLRSTSDPRKRLEAHYYLGLSQLRLGKVPESRKSFSIVIQAHPNNELYDKAVAGLIEGLYVTGFYQDVITECDRFIHNHPNSAYLSLVYLKLARANLKLMNWQQANELLGKIMKDFPLSMEAPIARQLLEEKQYFTVQVGAFEDKTRAVNLTTDLKNAKHYAYLVETLTPDGKKLYRVRVGQIDSLQKAKELENRLTKLGFPALIYP